MTIVGGRKVLKTRSLLQLHSSIVSLSEYIGALHVSLDSNGQHALYMAQKSSLHASNVISYTHCNKNMFQNQDVLFQSVLHSLYVGTKKACCLCGTTKKDHLSIYLSVYLHS